MDWGKNVERRDYRIVRRWPGWVIQRQWRGGWSQVGGRMSWLSAAAIVWELADWHVLADEDVRAVMRGEFPEGPAKDAVRRVLGREPS